MVKHKNRYGDIHTFTKVDETKIMWQGNFSHSRFSWPNVYKEAYEQYRKDGGDLHIEDFKKEVHRYIYDENDRYVGPSEIANKYATLVYSDRNTINMVDPSGGPYVTSGLDMGYFGEELKGLIVHSFTPTEDDEGYIINVYNKFDHLADTEIIGGIINTSK